MDILTIDGITFKADTIQLPHAKLLLIQGARGMLGCGYISMDAAEKFGDALAVVIGVNSYEEMLHAEVRKVSLKAEELGVKIGQTGLEALKLMS